MTLASTSRAGALENGTEERPPVSASQPRTVLETILDWSQDRPQWQRDALRRIVTGGAPDDAALAELLALCKKEHGATGITATPAVLEQAHLPANPGDGASICLAALGSVSGVNQLAAGQSIGFETAGLTVIYGPNGAGKSGYGRVLKRACRARKAGDIMPDVYNPTPSGKASASFTILRNGTPETPVTWQDSGRPDKILSAISVFDRDCGTAHVRDSNEVAFRPFGLDIPDDLAGACQKLKQLLTEEENQLKALRDPVFEKPAWNPATAVGRILSSLAHNTDLAPLEALGSLTAAERARLDRLKEDLLKNPVQAAAAQRLMADGVRRIIASLDSYAAAYADPVIGALKAKADAARTARAAAQAAATKAFDGLAVPGVGGEAWRVLWEAARRYADHRAFPGTSFPHEEGEPCVLCHQPLDAAAKARLQGFETFIKADAEAQADAAEASFKTALVFDDPVTSLDHRWRHKVAQRLVEECGNRQIIVFTHDMVFVNDLHDKAVQQGANVKLVSLSRGPAGTGIVTEGLPWHHASLKDRIDRLEKDGRAARALYDANDDEAYREAAVGIYSRLRASWERGLEDVVFAGVILRHRDYIDTKHLKKITAVESADVDTYRNNFKKCSDLVEAHDPSRGRDGAVPPPDEVMADIKALADWASAIRGKQNAIS